MEWYLSVWRKYAEFSGRARRKEYWMFVLTNMVVAFLLALMDVFAGTFDETVGIGALSGLYCVAVVVPSLAVGVRRLHDTGRSGWWWLLAVVPIVNIAFIVIMALNGERGPNQYGPDPKEELAPAMQRTVM